MESKIEVTEKTTLVLNKEERQWLRRAMRVQREESNAEFNMRNKFYLACGGDGNK